MAIITKLAISDRKRSSELCTTDSHKAGLDYIRSHTILELEGVTPAFARDYWVTALGGPRDSNHFERDGYSYRFNFNGNY